MPPSAAPGFSHKVVVKTRRARLTAPKAWPNAAVLISASSRSVGVAASPKPATCHRSGQGRIAEALSKFRGRKAADTCSPDAYGMEHAPFPYRKSSDNPNLSDTRCKLLLGTHEQRVTRTVSHVPLYRCTISRFNPFKHQQCIICIAVYVQPPTRICGLVVDYQSRSVTLCDSDAYTAKIKSRFAQSPSGSSNGRPGGGPFTLGKW